MPVVVLVAHSLDSQRRAAITAGGKEYGTKPFIRFPVKRFSSV
jgi:CheY-like chemotaxis protein